MNFLRRIKINKKICCCCFFVLFFHLCGVGSGGGLEYVNFFLHRIQILKIKNVFFSVFIYLFTFFAGGGGGS